MKKWMLCIMLMALLASACTKKGYNTKDNAQVPDTRVDCSTLDEAAKLVGFSIQVPDRMEGYPYNLIQAEKGRSIQVSYADKDFANDERSMIVIGKKNEDDKSLAGFLKEDRDDVVLMHGVKVFTKRVDQRICYASWMQSGYVYWIDSAEGLSDETLDRLIEQIA